LLNDLEIIENKKTDEEKKDDLGLSMAVFEWLFLVKNGRFADLTRFPSINI
jgi:hypothetical protein